MTHERAASRKQYRSRALRSHPALTYSYYAVLGLHPSASPIEIRRAYRTLSKRYHPDTTELSEAIAKAKFQQLNEAYGTLSNPEHRQAYDRTIGYSRHNVIQVPADLNRPRHPNRDWQSRAAYLDPTDRPLSAGELFAVLMMAGSVLLCLALAVAVAGMRSDVAITPIQPPDVHLTRSQTVGITAPHFETPLIFD
ncbi:MAG: J domain-containing protein [Limnospira sp.]